MNINRNPTASRQKVGVILGVFGLALVILGVKLTLDIYFSTRVEIDMNGKPALLFITNDQPCECVRKLISEADFQIENWSTPNRMEVQLIRISLGDHHGLEAKYDVFRAPALILLDAQGQVIHRQDYPLMGGKPFDLPEFESKMEELNHLQ